MIERRRNMHEVHSMKRKAINNNNEKIFEVSKQKERHIVTWTQEEDDILREQIRIQGTDNWTLIASNFKDKSTRQCRRRWYTYLNSDFKKGGWTPEEDMLLCEAQKIFGNRWTEIAKVVSGRTDNAVKNRFSTLCKKMAKREALAKENKNSFINLNNKRVIFPNGFNTEVSETAAPLKKMRMDISSLSRKLSIGGKLTEESGRTNHLVRLPFAVLAQNIQHGAGELSAEQHVNVTNNLSMQQQVNNMNKASTAAADNKIRGTFLKKDDPRILALLQQAELLSSLAIKVNSENTCSLENAWQVLQDYLGLSKESRAPYLENSYSSFQVESFRDLIEELRSRSEGIEPSLRQPDLLISSPGSSEYSTGTTLQSHDEGDKNEQGPAEQHGVTHQETEAEQESSLVRDQNVSGEADILAGSESNQSSEGALCRRSDIEFSSPSKVTPLFRSLAAAIPSPKFSESEKRFLLKTFELESPSSNRSANTSRPPPCKRVLLHSL